MKTTKAGRPKRTPEEAQKSCVSVWLTEAEKADVKRAAKAERMPASAWAGKVLVEAARRSVS